MTVAIQTPFNSYTANGATTAFAFTFLAIDAVSLVVRTNYGSPLTLGVDYTVSGVGVLSGGTVNFSVAPANGVIVTIARVTPLKRDTNYIQAGDWRPEVVNPDFDRLWLALQDLATGSIEFSNVLRTLPGDALAALPAASLRANRLIGFDSLGQPVATLPTAGDATALALDLLDTTIAGEGAGQVGFNEALAYAANRVGAALRNLGGKTTTRDTITATTVLTVSDFGDVQVDATSGSITLTLPALGTTTRGGVLQIIRLDSSANTVTVQRAGADTIGGATSITVGALGVVRIEDPSITSGTAWRITNWSAQTQAAARTAIGAVSAAEVPALAPAAPPVRQTVLDGPVGGDSATVTLAVASPGKVGWTGHPLQNNMPVRFRSTGTLPTGLAANTVYWVRNRTANDFEVSATQGGVAINFTGTPSGTHTAITGETEGGPLFGGTTGATTVTAVGTITATAANGTQNRTGSITNPSWTGLSTNGTMFLFLDIAADGTCTPGSTTLAPIYQRGGTPATTNGQATFNIGRMQMWVGNGSTASLVWRTFVGEVTVASGVVTSITWYALRGQYDSGFINTLPTSALAISRNSNLGVDLGVTAKLEIQCLTADAGYAVGDIVTEIAAGVGALVSPIQTWRTRNTVGFTSGSSTAFYAQNKSTGAGGGLTAASWAYKLTAQRGW